MTADLVERLRDVIAFLLGEAPLDGRWYGDEPPRGEGHIAGYGAPYWWRKPLREAASALRSSGEAVAAEDPYKALLRLPWVIGETYTTHDIPGLRIPCSYQLEWIDRSEQSFAVALWRDLERHTLHLQNLGDFQPPKAPATPPTSTKA